MRKVAAVVVALICSVSLAYGQSTDRGRGQGAFVLRQDAPLYKRSGGAATYGKMDKWDPVGGVQTMARMVESYQFEEEHGRVHVLALGTSGYMYTGWMDPSDLSRYFTYECGCGLADAKCSPHVFVGGVGKKKWNICFEEARAKALADLKNAAEHVEKVPATVTLGMSPEQVEGVLGKPSKIVDLGSKKIFVYSDMKVTFVDGKVSDVQ